MSITYEAFRDFAGPIATIIAATAAAFVTYRLGTNQVSIAREQARFAKANSRLAQQKLVLDLFDKRWTITTELRETVAEVLTQGHVGEHAWRKFHLAGERAAFLFGPEVTTYLAVIRASLSRHKAAEAFRDSDNDEKRSRAADQLFKEFEIIQEFYTSFDVLIAPYMQMHDKVPSDR